MKRTVSLFSLLSVLLLVTACGDSPTAPEVSSRFDDLGVNRVAGLFNGPADLADGRADGLYFGSPLFASDKLLIKWNHEYQRGIDERWSDPDGYAGAYYTNQWNGNVPGGSGIVWHYKVVWTSTCPVGSVCIQSTQGIFEIIMSHGTVDSEHIWAVHKIPPGLGFVNR